jgi:hypothetical protein
MYDKHFQQKWLADTALIDGMKYRGYAADHQNTYIFFIDQDRIKAAFNMQVIKLDYAKDSFDILNLNVPENIVSLDIKIVEKQAFIAYNNSDFEPGIIVLNLKTGAAREINPEIEGQNIIQQLYFGPGQQHGYLVIENYLGKRQNALMVFELSKDAKTLRKYTINPAIENKVLNEARIASAKGDTLILIGTYHNDVAKLRGNSEDEAIESAGYFFCRFEGDKQTLINYYNFLEFEEMYRSLSSKSLAEIRRKAEKQKNKGGEYSLQYTVLLHDVIPFGDEFVIISEAYYPEYRTVTNMYYDYYGRPIPQTYTVFDGYKYISGIIASFSGQGELVWDNGIEITNILTFNLNKLIGNYTSEGEIAFFYSNENKINYKIISADMEPGALQDIKLEKLYKSDKLMEDLGSKMIHWYDNYFICYGYQKIRNNRISGGKRTVFYFSKLAFN